MPGKKDGWYRSPDFYRRYSDDHGRPPWDLDHTEKVRLGRLLARVDYRRWAFTVELIAGVATFSAFRSDPEQPRRLQKLGPWPLPVDAGPAEAETAASAAVVATDGRGALAEFRYRAAK